MAIVTFALFITAYEISGRSVYNFDLDFYDGTRLNINMLIESAYRIFYLMIIVTY